MREGFGGRPRRPRAEGGAAGFPFPPADTATVLPALDRILGQLAPDTCRLLTASTDGEPAGWLVIRRDRFELIAHWGTVHHVQTRPAPLWSDC